MPVDDVLETLLTPPGQQSPRHTRASTNQATRIQRLHDVLPLTLSTHQQYSFSHTLAEDNPHSPTFHSSELQDPHMIYPRLLAAHAQATAALAQPNTVLETPIDPASHLFVPTVALHGLRRQLQELGQLLQKFYQERVRRSASEIMYDYIFTPPIDGFGVKGLQIYFKRGFCITWIHDELLWSSALNFMMPNSVGAALWIGIGLHCLKQYLNMTQIDIWFARQNPDILEVGKLLDVLIATGIPIEYVWQHPGQLVASPPGGAAAHLVISYGVFATQLAWNFSCNLVDMTPCLSFWGEPHTGRDFDHYYQYNGSMATRTVLPLMTMQAQRYPTNYSNLAVYYHDGIKQLQTKNIKLNLST
jgi:hypothetical protein